MHASTSELLSLRDAAAVDARVAQHIASCAHCARELQLLSRTRERLHALASFDAPPDAWSRIEQATARAPVRRFPRRWLGAAAATLAITVGLIIIRDQPATIALHREPAAMVIEADEPIASLVAHSQKLEHLLQALPQRPMVERVSTAATIDTLEQRVQWLDFQLSHAPAGSFDATQTQRLWRERVELMDSLVKVRYAEAERLSF